MSKPLLNIGSIMRLSPHRVLFLGSNPSIKSNTCLAFQETKSAEVLKGWVSKLGLNEEIIEYANVADHKTEDNRKLSNTEIDANRSKLIGLTRNKIVVCLGYVAWKAAYRLLNSYSPREYKVVFIRFQHPSGLNRNLNDKDRLSCELKQLRFDIDGLFIGGLIETIKEIGIIDIRQSYDVMVPYLN